MILVTGANGFIGGALAQDLSRSGQEVIASDLVPLTKRSALGSAKYSEFLDPFELLSKWTASEWKKLDGIFHLGACSDTTETDWEYLKKVNLTYSQELFKIATQFEIPFLYASSGAVYGDGSQGFDDQISPSTFTPLNLYGRSKKEFDEWVLNQSKAPPLWYGFRFFNVYGSDESHKGEMSSVVFKAFNQIKTNGSLALFKSHKQEYKDGEQLRDFVYIKDINRWMIEIFQSKAFKPGIYNMGYGKARTWLDLAHCVFKSMNKEMNIKWIDIPSNIRDQYQYYTEAKMEALFSQGLSRPQWPIEEGIPDYIKNSLA